MTIMRPLRLLTLATTVAAADSAPRTPSTLNTTTSQHHHSIDNPGPNTLTGKVPYDPKVPLYHTLKWSHEWGGIKGDLSSLAPRFEYYSVEPVLSSIMPDAGGKQKSGYPIATEVPGIDRPWNILLMNAASWADLGIRSLFDVYESQGYNPLIVSGAQAETQIAIHDSQPRLKKIDQVRKHCPVIRCARQGGSPGSAVGGCDHHSCHPNRRPWGHNSSDNHIWVSAAIDQATNIKLTFSSGPALRPRSPHASQPIVSHHTFGKQSRTCGSGE